MNLCIHIIYSFFELLMIYQLVIYQTCNDITQPIWYQIWYHINWHAPKTNLLPSKTHGIHIPRCPLQLTTPYHAPSKTSHSPNPAILPKLTAPHLFPFAGMSPCLTNKPMETWQTSPLVQLTAKFSTGELRYVQLLQWKVCVLMLLRTISLSNSLVNILLRTILLSNSVVKYLTEDSFTRSHDTK